MLVGRSYRNIGQALRVEGCVILMEGRKVVGIGRKNKKTTKNLQIKTSYCIIHLAHGVDKTSTAREDQETLTFHTNPVPSGVKN